MPSPHIEFTFRPRWRGIVLGGGLAALFAAVLLAMTLTNKQGARVQGYDLSPNGATILYGVLTVLCLGGAAVFGWLGYNRLHSRQRLTLTDELFLFPHKWTAREVAVPYSDILRLNMQSTHSDRFIHVQYVGGHLPILDAWVDPKSDFDRLWNELRMRVDRLHT